VQAAVDRIHGASGRVDLLLNAAGVHHGGTVATTSLERLRLVRDTKLVGYLNLRAAFTHLPPRRWYNVGSLLAVLGWPGEAAYCAGNDLLDASAPWQQQHGQPHETTLAMALWDEAGFAAEPVTRELLRRQGALTGLPTRTAVALFLAELALDAAEPGGPVGRTVTYLGRAERELLARDGGGGPDVAARSGVGARTPHPGPLPGGPERGDRSSVGREIWYRPDLERDGYLQHHRLRGVPILPAALIAELAAEAAEDGGSGLRLRDLVFHAPVGLRPGAGGSGGGYRLVIEQEARGRTDHRLAVRVVSDVVAPSGRVLRRDRLHATATVVAGAGHPPSGVAGPLARAPVVTPPWYREGSSLRLDGPFRSLREVMVGPQGATARFGPDLGPWTERLRAMRLPVLLLDALVQLAVLAPAARSGEPGADADLIPGGIEQIDVFTELADGALLDRYGDGIGLTADFAGGARASSPDGLPLLEVRGVRAAVDARARAAR
jgi:hypothetical protein